MKHKNVRPLIIEAEHPPLRKNTEFWTIDLKANNISTLKNDFVKLVGTKVSVDGNVYMVIGVESFALPNDSHQNKIGLMVKILE